MSSYGHICDLKKKEFSINTKTFEPEYEIPAEKEKLVNTLKSEVKKADMVWLASDEDREGEAISWHLYEVLELTPEKTKRIVFHEITKEAITNAIKAPREIDINLVNAQQARRVLDRIVGFKLSPVLWKKVKPSLSAGRVQSVAVRLIVEREREIQAFVPEAAYRVVAVFLVPDAEGNTTELKAELGARFKEKAEAEHKAKIEAETSAIKEKFDAIVNQGCFRQLDWKSALRQLDNVKSEFKTAEGQIAADLQIRKVNDMKKIHDIFIKSLPNHVFKGKLKGMKVVKVNEKELELVRVDGKRVDPVGQGYIKKP